MFAQPKMFRVIHRKTEGIRRYHGWPSVCKDENDNLYAIVSYRMLHIDPFGQDCLFKSTDGGSSWSEPKVVVDTPLDDRDAGLLYLGNGKMLMTYFTHNTDHYVPGGDWDHWRRPNCVYSDWITEEDQQKVYDTWATMSELELQGGAYVRLSEDYGETWSDDIAVPVSSPHGPTRLSDGSLLYVGRLAYISAYAQRTGDTTDWMEQGGDGIGVIASYDEGKTWTKVGMVTLPADATVNGGHLIFCEPHAIQLSNGTIALGLRVENKKVKNGSEGQRFYFCTSDDMGKTWTMPEIIRTPDGNELVGTPPHLLELQNGSLLMTYGRRIAPTGHRAVVSKDGGKTWSEELYISQPWNPADGDLGYPATEQLSDGTLVTVYYERCMKDHCPSFLCTKWNLIED